MALIVYACIAQEGSIVADYTAPQAFQGNRQSINFDIVARNHIPKIYSDRGSSTILGYPFHHLISGGLLAICVTDVDGSDIPEKFLNELTSSITPQIVTNTNKRGEMLTRLLTHYVNAYNNTSEKFKSIESSLVSTTEAIRGNIGNLLERGELMDSIVSKSENLKDTTFAFRNTAKMENSSFLSRFLYENIKNKRIFIALTVWSE